MLANRINQKLAVAVVSTAASLHRGAGHDDRQRHRPHHRPRLPRPAASVDSVAIGFLVSLAVVMPASGWLGDRFGNKRIMLFATTVFTVASALCGAAQNLGQLVLFRILQGVGGGMLMPIGMAMLFHAFPPSERIRVAGIMVVPDGVRAGPRTRHRRALHD